MQARGLWPMRAAISALTAATPLWTMLLLITTLIAHAPALRAGFVYDDRRDIVLNPSAQAETIAERLALTVRPLLKASYAVQDALHGMNAFAFHAVNLGLHLVAVVLVFHLLRRLFCLAGGDADKSGLVAGLATALWALHPALTDTVSYVSGRSMGLSSLLVLGALLAATARRPWPVLAFACAALAPLARETALVAPLLLMAVQITVGRGQTGQFRRAVPVWLGALVAALMIAAMARHRELLAFSLDQRGPIDALRANLFAVPEILRLWVMPWDISILPSQPIAYGWTDPPTLIRLAGLVLTAGLGLGLRKRVPVLAFALLWTLLALLPTNSLIWRVDPVAVRPLYLAGIGVSLLAAMALARLPFGRWLGLGIALGLSVMTVDRASLFQDEVALFADAATKAPESAHAQAMLGLVLANAGRLDEARAALEQALRIDPFLTEAANAFRLLDVTTPIYRQGP